MVKMLTYLRRSGSSRASTSEVERANLDANTGDVASHQTQAPEDDNPSSDQAEQKHPIAPERCPTRSHVVPHQTFDSAPSVGDGDSSGFGERTPDNLQPDNELNPRGDRDPSQLGNHDSNVTPANCEHFVNDDLNSESQPSCGPMKSETKKEKFQTSINFAQTLQPIDENLDQEDDVYDVEDILEASALDTTSNADHYSDHFDVDVSVCEDECAGFKRSLKHRRSLSMSVVDEKSTEAFSTDERISVNDLSLPLVSKCENAREVPELNSAVEEDKENVSLRSRGSKNRKSSHRFSLSATSLKCSESWQSFQKAFASPVCRLPRKLTFKSPSEANNKSLQKYAAMNRLKSERALLGSSIKASKVSKKSVKKANSFPPSDFARKACQVCVHEHSCRDNISDCSKLKTSKGFPKPGVPLSAAAKSSSLGSNPSSGGPSILSSGVLSHSSGVASRARSTVGHSSSPTRPHSLIASNTRGVNDDKDGGEALQETTDNNILDTNSASMESLDDASEEPASSNSSTLDDIDGDPDLRLLEKEPELWVHTVDQATVDGLTDRQVKKQEHIYELIITEKHHCRMLRVMQKVFVAGMTRELGMPQNRVRRVFPCLDELLTLHCSFLWRLRQKQRDNKYIATIGDLLLEQFVGDNAQGLKDAYGVFCSHHQDAVSYFKELCKTDRRFNAFIAQRYSHPLMKKKGIPECILFMTHRITKYPLMIEAIIKYSRDQEEESAILKRALENIKEILVNINSQVAEKERKQRLLEIYHKIDAKSSTTYKDLKFKKSDLLNNSRTLKFEGTAVLLQQRGKPLLVQVVVMSDLVFFVHENNQKYYFVSPDNKAGVIPLEKLLIREKAGDNARAIYFIHEKNQAEMFEMECQHPKDKKIWFCSIREAVEQCPDEEEGSDGASGSTVTANAERLRHLLATLQHKDRDIAQLCEEKEACMAEILSEWGCPSQHLVAQSPQLRALLDELSVDPAQARQLQIKSLTDAMKLVSGACGWGSGLARSVSSVGEHQSDAYVSPSLPKRAETFGGFDNSNKDGNTAAAGAAAAQNTAAAPQLQTKAAQSGGKKKKDGSRMAAAAAVAAADPSSADSSELSVSKRLAANARRPSASLLTPRASQDNLSLMSGFSSDVSTVVGSAQDLMHQQQENAARLMSCLHVALVLSQHHITQHEMLLRGSSLGSNTEARFRHSQKLEELRNIQEQISLERHSYAKERDAREKWLQDKSDQLHALEESLKAAEEDVCQQRDLLYRQLEVLKNQGIILSPSLNVFFNSGCPSPGSLKGDTSGSSHSSPTGGIPTTRPHKAPRSTPPITKRDSSTALPTHLISATNQQKGPVSVKQQLPMKLAKLGSGGSSSSSSSMSSSLGGSMGGSMSPSQEQRASPNVSHMSKSSGQSSVTQILPLKLSESVGESRKGSGGYQRLHSPPPPVGEDSGNPSTHHRTGSSPATLQNGSNNPTPDVAAGILGAGSVSGSLASGGQKAARTNTYPKLANKPTLLPASGTGSLGAREGGSVAAQQQLMQQQMSQLQQQQQHSSQLQQQFTTQLHQQQPTQLLQHQQLIQHQQQLLLQQQQQQQAPSISNTRPGQRIKDPDTNEDIIFF